MAADVELLPLPELPRQVEGYSSDYWEAGQIEEYATDYARANVLHHTAAQAAEIEALRAEVARLMTIAGWGGLAGDAPDRLILASEMFEGIACCDKWLTVRRIGDGDQPVLESATAYVRADIAEQAEARAERLAEALRDARNRMLGQVKWVACDCGCERDKPADAASVAWLRASALLRDQENDDD